MIKLTCCVQCQIFWSCKTKWLRAERGQEQTCCERCNWYVICQRIKSKLKPTKVSSQ